ncbi:DeoR family transcriptional regulator [Vibrio lentus]|nr:DeoR family transcriptional regulator [Vibrio lentus]
MKQIPRHQQIVDLVKTQGCEYRRAFVEKFDVSPQTIR